MRLLTIGRSGHWDRNSSQYTGSSITQPLNQPITRYSPLSGSVWEVAQEARGGRLDRGATAPDAPCLGRGGFQFRSAEPPAVLPARLLLRREPFVIGLHRPQQRSQGLPIQTPSARNASLDFQEVLLSYMFPILDCQRCVAHSQRTKGQTRGTGLGARRGPYAEKHPSRLGSRGLARSQRI